LSDADVQRIVETAAHRLVRLLQQCGVLDDAAGDALTEKEPLLAALSAASIEGQHPVASTRVLALNARDRSQVVPPPPSPAASTAPGAPVPSIHPHRFFWAALLARVFALDVTVCLACGGRRRRIAALTDPASVRRYLQGVGLPTEPIPLTPSPP
jgi:hypothetical protein